MNQVFSSDPSVPQVTEALLRHLEQAFPLQGFMVCANEAQFRRYQGAIDVVDHLRSIHASQQNPG